MPLWSWLLLAALALAPAVFWRGGVLEEETIVFLNHYLDQRTVAQKVFDPHGNDFDTYQARELSYLFDLGDAQWFRVLLRRGVVLFIPPSAVLATLLTGVVFGKGSARAFPRLPAATRSLVLLVLLTNYVFVTTMGLFYRATKPLLVPVLLGLLFYLWARLRSDVLVAAPLRDFTVVFLLGGLMCAFDRQGFFYLVVFGAALFLVWAVHRVGAVLGLAVATAAASGIAYNYAIGPWLIHAVNGYWPRFNYQRMPLRKLVDPGYYLKAAELLPGYTATLFGGFPLWLFAAILGLTLLAWVRLWREEPEAPTAARKPYARGLGPALLILFASSQVFMFAAMIMRYPQVYDWADHRLWYYPWPFQAILAFGLLIALDSVWLRTDRGAQRLMNAALIVLAVANLVQWPRHREISLHSDWFPKIHDQTERLKSSLRQGRADPQLYGAYREFLHFAWDLSPALSSRIEGDLREGAGFYRTELHDGRVFAWARAGATMGVEVAKAGNYSLRGEAWLRPGESVVVSGTGSEIGRIQALRGEEGPVPLALELTLPAGRTELHLESNLPERDVGGIRDRKAAAFGLFLPVLETARTTR